MTHPTPRIDDHAVLGDGRSAALVDREGTIDWLCWPVFDSPALFASLLDQARGGQFRMAPAGPHRATRRYLDATNVLETRFEGPDGLLRLVDLMSIASREEACGRLEPEHELLRLATCERGEVALEILVDLRPCFGARRACLVPRAGVGLRADLGAAAITLQSDVSLAVGSDGVARGRTVLHAGESAAVSLSYDEEAPAVLPAMGVPALGRAARTIREWRAFAATIRYDGPWREAVVRSVLLLKLLRFAPSGAFVAAPTTSLPERVRGDLNWDYRFCWLRDAALTVRAMYGLGHAPEAEAFTAWLLHTTRLTSPALRVLYDVYGRKPAPERTLDLAGYRGSRPVRVGNAAVDQLQLDVYGEVMASVTQAVKRGVRLDRATQGLLRGLGAFVCEHWRDPDSGIWEPREVPRQRTHSIALCWTSLARLVGLARGGQLLRAPVERYEREMRAIREAIETRGWSPALDSYVAELDGDRVDAALLQLGWHGYADPASPRMRGTWRAIARRLSAGRPGLLYRNEPSRAAGEGAFGICCFWAAEHLARGGGTLAEAERLFSDVLRYRNDLGLLAEEIDPASGEALGNFPQAFSHVGLISTALALEERARATVPARPLQGTGGEASP